MLEVLRRLLGRRAEAPNSESTARAALAGQNRAETRLRHSEQQFTDLVAGVRDYAIFLLDRQGNVVSWNAGAERIKGYRPEEIIGQNFSRFYPQGDCAILGNLA